MGKVGKKEDKHKHTKTMEYKVEKMSYKREVRTVCADSPEEAIINFDLGTKDIPDEISVRFEAHLVEEKK